MLRQVSKNVDSIQMHSPLHYYFAHSKWSSLSNIGEYDVALCLQVNMIDQKTVRTESADKKNNQNVQQY